MNKKIIGLGTGFVLLSVLTVAQVGNVDTGTANTTQAAIAVVTTESAVTYSAITDSAVVKELNKTENKTTEEAIETDGIITVNKEKYKTKYDKYVIDKSYEVEEGKATWYGGRFNGRKTTNGEIFDTNKFTAAHRNLPFGTLVKVTNLRNGKYVIVRINDRCHAAPKKIRIDLTYAAYTKIGTKKDDGFMSIKIEKLIPIEDKKSK